MFVEDETQGFAHTVNGRVEACMFIEWAACGLHRTTGTNLKFSSVITDLVCFSPRRSST